MTIQKLLELVREAVLAEIDLAKLEDDPNMRKSLLNYAREDTKETWDKISASLIEDPLEVRIVD